MNYDEPEQNYYTNAAKAYQKIEALEQLLVYCCRALENTNTNMFFHNADLKEWWQDYKKEEKRKADDKIRFDLADLNNKKHEKEKLEKEIQALEENLSIKKYKNK